MSQEAIIHICRSNYRVRARSGRSSRSSNIPALWRATATLHRYSSAEAGRQRRIGVDRDMKVLSSLGAMPSRSGGKVLRMTRRRVLTAMLVVAQQTCFATSIYVDLDQAVAQADVIAEVEIVEGRLAIGSVGQRCGAVYDAVVPSAVKGPEVGATILFSPFSGHGIGNRYVVLLVKAGASGDSTYSFFKDPLIAGRIPAGREEAARAQCESGYAPLRETG